jgi:mono/diheme cytochrome c family protein
MRPKLPPMPKMTLPILALLFSLSLVPLLLVTRARAIHFRQPRLHLIPDMDHQSKFRAQAQNVMFADGRAMRMPVEGTVARGELHADDHLERGLQSGEFAAAFPMEVTEAVLQRGQERYGIFCSPCHGLDGMGAGVVAVRADRLQEGKWVPPSSVHTDLVRSRPVGHLFNTITNGIRTMPPYGPQIPVRDRWAIVAYVRALQRSQAGTMSDVPPEERATLR